MTDANYVVERVDPEESSTAVQSMVGKEVLFLNEIAQRNPRSVTRFLEEATSMVSRDEETAESMMYSLKRWDGKQQQYVFIPGPSVRLAEVLLSAWGNIIVCNLAPIISDTTVTGRAICMDVQKNVMAGTDAVRRITTTEGKRYSDDMINVTIGAAQSIARRNAIFEVLPRVYVQQVYRIAREVAVGKQKPLTARRRLLSVWVDQLGIPISRVFAAIGVKGLEEVQEEHLTILLGIRNRIAEGDLSPDDAFPEIEEASGADKARDTKPTGPKLPPKSKQRGPKKKPVAAQPPVGTEEIEAKIRDLYEQQDKFWLETTNNQTMTIEPELWDTIGQFKLKDVILTVRQIGNKQHVVAIREAPQGD
jgi:hypothetical protein